jgi:hypothetical protein
MVSAVNVETIKQVFTQDQPLGQISAIDSLADASQTIYKSYFDKNNFPMRRLARTHPIMIIGRKGAGKTDALLSAQLDTRFRPLVYFNYTDSAKFFTQILSQIHQTIQANRVTPLVEEVAAFWRSLFWIATIATIVGSARDKQDPKIETLRRFVIDLGIGGDLRATPYHFVLRAILWFREKYKRSEFDSTGIDFFECFEEITISDMAVESAVECALQYLNEINRQAIILFDSFETLDVRDQHNQLAISALIKCVADFQKPGVPAHVRCCIPAESYFYFLDVSSNVLKDFQKSQFLHWHARELLKIAAIRYATFIEVWQPDAVRQMVRPFDLRSEKTTQAFWDQFLPATVTNGANQQQELTIPYLLRHTQLLPRQLLLIFNSVFSASFAENRSYTSKVSPHAIVRDIKIAENLITEQIIDSYKNIWPTARQVLETTLPKFAHYGGNIISYSDLHRVFNATPRTYGGDTYTFPEYVRLLTELGVIGRLVRRERNYATGIFEYSEPHKLLLTPDDTLCVHPVFTEKFRAILPVQASVNAPEGEAYVPIYPLGCDPDSEDRRPGQQWY